MQLLPQMIKGVNCLTYHKMVEFIKEQITTHPFIYYVVIADAANMMLIYFIITIIFTLPYLCSFEPNLHCL